LELCDVLRLQLDLVSSVDAIGGKTGFFYTSQLVIGWEERLQMTCSLLSGY